MTWPGYEHMSSQLTLQHTVTLCITPVYSPIGKET